MARRLDVAAAELCTWLDGFAEASVVYVCFGSMVVLLEPHAAAMAAALERTWVAFVWAAGPAASLPAGFEERMEAFVWVAFVWAGGRGTVVRGWVPQGGGSPAEGARGGRRGSSE
ncbi:unnamed protein product [Miscanthus lutarioriparius]|uniref:Uncharacterized protein n=1 Tax=Miscanthus lutarioriparius TaxID=422564 RepID=A0A811MU81_9POAL|nr:unnamed protein product [Miscanthus lutarioriparius]